MGEETGARSQDLHPVGEEMGARSQELHPVVEETGARSLELHPGPPLGCQGPKCLGCLPCPSQGVAGSWMGVEQGCGSSTHVACQRRRGSLPQAHNGCSKQRRF